MSLPTPNRIKEHHRAHGGLWRIVPAATSKGQPRPIIAQLALDGNGRPCFEGGCLETTLEDGGNASLRGAEWIPVDTQGDRVE